MNIRVRLTSSFERSVDGIIGELLSFSKLQLGFLWREIQGSVILMTFEMHTVKSAALSFFFFELLGILRVVGGRDQVHTNFFDRTGCFIPDVDHVLVTHVVPHIHSALVL